MEDREHDDCCFHHELAEFYRRNRKSERQVREVKEEIHVAMQRWEKWKEDKDNKFAIELYERSKPEFKLAQELDQKDKSKDCHT